MMRIVLDNTDNAQHGEALKPAEAPKQRNTYLLQPECTVNGAGGNNNGNGNTHSVVNAKLNTHTAVLMTAGTVLLNHIIHTFYMDIISTTTNITTGMTIVDTVIIA